MGDCDDRALLLQLEISLSIAVIDLTGMVPRQPALDDLVLAMEFD